MTSGQRHDLALQQPDRHGRGRRDRAPIQQRVLRSGARCRSGRRPGDVRRNLRVHLVGAAGSRGRRQPGPRHGHGSGIRAVDGSGQPDGNRDRDTGRGRAVDRQPAAGRGDADSQPTRIRAGRFAQLERLEGMRVHVDQLVRRCPDAGDDQRGERHGIDQRRLLRRDSDNRAPIPRARRRGSRPVAGGVAVLRAPVRLQSGADSGRQQRPGIVRRQRHHRGHDRRGRHRHHRRARLRIADLHHPAGLRRPGNGQRHSTASLRCWMRRRTSSRSRTANLERFFDTVNDPSTSDVVLTPAAFANRLIKVSHADPGRDEDARHHRRRGSREHRRCWQAIANQVNADTSDAVHYVAYLFEGNDIGGIDDGLLVNTGCGSPSAALTPGREGRDLHQPAGRQPDLLNDRPPTVLRATIHTAADAPLDVTVIANHLRSLNDIDDGLRTVAESERSGWRRPSISATSSKACSKQGASGADRRRRRLQRVRVQRRLRGRHRHDQRARQRPPIRSSWRVPTSRTPVPRSSTSSNPIPRRSGIRIRSTAARSRWITCSRRRRRRRSSPGFSGGTAMPTSRRP